MKINLKIDNQTKYTPNIDLFNNITESVLLKTGLDGIVEIGLTICGKALMQKLNNQYRNIDSPTDVLSFPVANLSRGKKVKETFPINPDTPINLGDIFICLPVAEQQSREQNIGLEKEFLTLYKHGLKHLLGFHHK